MSPQRGRRLDLYVYIKDLRTQFAVIEFYNKALESVSQGETEA